MIRLLRQSDESMVLKYLERNEIETCFLYGNITQFGLENRKEMRRCADYYGYFDGALLKGLISFYNLGSCIPHYEDMNAVPLFIELMKEKNFEFLMGMQKIIKPLYEEIKAYKEINTYSESYYFTNRNFKPFILENLNFIDVKGKIKDQVVDFIVHARANGFNQPMTIKEARDSIIQRGEEEVFIMAQSEGKLVAQAAVQTYTPHMNQIGAVFTLEEERGKGYCKATVSEICKRIIDRGKIPTLSVKKENTPAVKAYEALGFEYYDDYLIIRMKV